jgi:hypothetical protein
MLPNQLGGLVSRRLVYLLLFFECEILHGYPHGHRLLALGLPLFIFAVCVAGCLFSWL